ncbi:hypothetical protein Tco_0647078 [Tanacetum coccineum]
MEVPHQKGHSGARRLLFEKELMLLDHQRPVEIGISMLISGIRAQGIKQHSNSRFNHHSRKSALDKKQRMKKLIDGMEQRVHGPGNKDERHMQHNPGYKDSTNRDEDCKQQTTYYGTNSRREDQEKEQEDWKNTKIKQIRGNMLEKHNPFNLCEGVTTMLFLYHQRPVEIGISMLISGIRAQGIKQHSNSRFNHHSRKSALDKKQRMKKLIDGMEQRVHGPGNKDERHMQHNPGYKDSTNRDEDCKQQTTYYGTNSRREDDLRNKKIGRNQRLTD